MKRYLFNCYKRILVALSMPIIFAEYFNEKTGKEYNVGFFKKLSLAWKMKRNTKKIISASNFFEHLTMAIKILNIPRAVDGCVVECGSYKGGSTANLSLVCDLCGRTLEVFDSFEGLPEPSGSDKSHVIVDKKEIHTYSKGAWRGSLDEVKRNISKYGKIKICNFNVGYFNETLPHFHKKCAFVFLDVDLRDSLRTCLINFWPLLQNGCYLFTHEAHHLEIASLFFDKAWWRDNLNSDPPGLIGAGSGLGLVPAVGHFRSAIGYAVKNSQTPDFKEVPQTGVVSDVAGRLP